MSQNITHSDITLIGAGVMSATLGVLLKELQPGYTIQAFERLDKIAAESSDAWNNAGTGHSGLCELNYCPQRPDGSVDASKAAHIVEMFEVSKQFWSYLVQKGSLPAPHTFINSCPHISFVTGAADVSYLAKRYEAMSQNHLFAGITFTKDHEKLKEWMPLIMDGRDPAQEVAATRSDLGTDVNFGTLTRSLFAHLQEQDGVSIHLRHEVRHLRQRPDGHWQVTVKDLTTGDTKEHLTNFVFIGAGGGALLLLEKSHIDEAKGYGGFPVSGQWLRCTNKAVIAQHHAKVYGKAAVGSPPMSVPHLDTRIIDGEQQLLFGPYAGFNTKFLKEGSYLDLPLSVRAHNISAMLGAGIHNMELTNYLIRQVLQSPEHRFRDLQEFFPGAQQQDWELVVAGQRVQVIKKDPKQGGILEFGTEIVSHADNTIAALLGASPGASTSVYIMLDLLSRCFAGKLKTDTWQTKLKEMIPTYGKKLGDDLTLTKDTRTRTHSILMLKAP